VIQYSIVRIKEARVAAVLVGRKDLSGPGADLLIRNLESQLPHPVMLVCPDDTALAGAKAYADFDPMPYLYELLATRDVDWMTLPQGRCMEGA
jgi:hypothetical protein